MSEPHVPEIDKKSLLDAKKLEKTDIISLLKQQDVSPINITLSPQYQEYLGGKEQMPQEDFQFVEELLARYGISQDRPREAEQRPFGEEEFFLAVTDIKKYAMGLREKADGKYGNEPFREDLDADTQVGRSLLDAYKIGDQHRPSSPRIRDISILFLHVPQVRKVYTRIHAEKLVRALPLFQNKLEATPTFKFSSLHEYFANAFELLKEANIEAVPPLANQRAEDLGMIMEYARAGYMVPNGKIQRRLFATIGIGSLTEVLEGLAWKSIQSGDNYIDEIIKESSPGGTIFRGMRTHQHNSPMSGRVAHADLNIVRNKLENNQYPRGLCPAATPILSEDGERRPLELEYALTIAKNIPSKLLRSAQ